MSQLTHIESVAAAAAPGVCVLAFSACGSSESVRCWKPHCHCIHVAQQDTHQAQPLVPRTPNCALSLLLCPDLAFALAVDVESGEV